MRHWALLLLLLAAALPIACRPLEPGTSPAAPAADAADLPPLPPPVDQRPYAAATQQQQPPPLEFTPLTAATLLLSMAVAALSNAAGVGGGAIFVPLFHALLGLGLKAASALSQAAITGGALGSVAYSLGRRQQLIDFDATLAICPALLLGVSAGVLLNLALPATLLALALIALLAFLTWRTGATGLRLRRAEQAEALRLQQALGKQQVWRSSRKLVLELAEASAAAAPSPQQPPKPPGTPPGDRTSSDSEGWRIATTAGAAGGPLAEQQPGGPADSVALDRWRSAPPALPGTEHTPDRRPQPAAQLAAVPERQQSGGLRRWLSSPDADAVGDGVLEPETPRCCSPVDNRESQPGEAAADDGGGCGGGSTGALPPPALRFPHAKAAQLLLLWVLFVGFLLSRARFPRCSWQHWALFGSQAALALGLAAAFSWLATRGGRQTRRDADAQPILAGGSSSAAAACPPPAWTRRKLATAIAVALVGGTVAGTLGIGGGMLLCPLLLELGVHPLSASATSALMVLFSASTAVLAFAAAGRLPLGHAAVFGPACLAAAFAGTFFIGRAVRRSGRSSLLVLLLAGIIGLGAAVTVAFAGRHALVALAAGGDLWAGGAAFCS